MQQNFRNAQLCMAEYDQGLEKRRATVPWESQGKHPSEVMPEGSLIGGACPSGRGGSKAIPGESDCPKGRSNEERTCFTRRGESGCGRVGGS